MKICAKKFEIKFNHTNIGTNQNPPYKIKRTKFSGILRYKQIT